MMRIVARLSAVTAVLSLAVAAGTVFIGAVGVGNNRAFASRYSPAGAEVVGTMDDLKQQQVEAVIDVGGAPGAPDWQVAGDDAMWVANGSLSTIQRIDPATNAVTSVQDTIGRPCAGMASGFGSIWAPSCLGAGEIDRIDPKTMHVVARIKVGPAASEGQIAADDHGVWVVTFPARKMYVEEIDPQTNKVAARIQVPVTAAAVTAGFGALWVTVPDQGKVLRVDPVRRKVVAKIKVHLGPRFLAAGEGGVWVLNQSDGSVSHIDPTTNKVVATVDAKVAGDGGCIAAGLGKVWVTMPGTPFLSIDPSSNTITERYTGDGGDCIGTGFGSVWLSNHQFGNVWRIRP